MTTSRLPEITVTCRNSHSFQTRAHGGQGVDCPECRACGERIKVWIRKDRPRNARELADQAAEDAPAGRTAAAVPVGPDPELVARWAQEAPWDGKLRAAPGRAGDLCPECGDLLHWEPGRTRVFCGPCKRAGLPAAVTGHYERQAARRAEVAVRTAPDGSALRAARARLRAMKETARSRVDDWLDTIADEDSHDRVQWQRQARELGAMLRGYLPEIGEAQNEAELAEVWREIDALVTGNQGRALAVEYEQAQERAERQHEARQRAAEFAQQQREIEARQIREDREAERAAKAREVEQARQRKAITSGTPDRRTTATGLAPVTGQLAVMIEQSRQEKARKIAANGECAFKHWGQVVATRLYSVPVRDWQGNMNGYAVANTPQYRACSKHYAEADARLNADGYSDTCYWDLPLQQQGQTGSGYATY